MEGWLVHKFRNLDERFTKSLIGTKENKFEEVDVESRRTWRRHHMGGTLCRRRFKTWST